jgi:hypothetical protein
MTFMFVQLDEVQNINLIMCLKWLQEQVMNEYLHVVSTHKCKAAYY